MYIKVIRNVLLGNILCRVIFTRLQLHCIVGEHARATRSRNKPN